MGWVITGIRLLTGAVFFVFGLNGFVTFLEVPPPVPFMEILVASGYLYAVKTLEVIGGLLLLFNRYVALGLVLLGPVAVNIALYHALLDPRNAIVGYGVFVLVFFLVWAYRGAFAGVFQARVEPTAS